MWTRALVGAALCIAACEGEKNCTLIDCSDQFNVVLQSGEPFETGEYVIRVSSGATRAECKLTVTADADEMPQCETGEHHAHWEDCDPPSKGAPSCRKLTLLYSVRERSTAPLDVVVTRDGTTRLERSAQPRCEAFAPNGPGCGPVCTSCGVALSLP